MLFWMNKLFLTGMVRFSGFQFAGWVDPTQTALGLLKILCSSLTQIFGSTIRVGQCYTRRGRVSLTPGELVGTPGPRHRLNEYMDRDDVGWPSLSHFGWETKPIWAYLIVIFIYVAHLGRLIVILFIQPIRACSLLFYYLCLMGRAQQQNVLG